MSAKKNKLISQEGKKDYSEEEAEDIKEISQGDNEFILGDKEFKEARAEEIAFDRARVEENASMELSNKAWSMAGYKTRTVIYLEEEEEEENSEGNREHPETNPIGGSHGWEKESAARACLERARNLAGYATGLSNGTEEEEEEEYTVGNHKQPTRNPVRVNQG